MKVHPPLCANAGFTLIESMLALSILSISLLALAGLQITALRGNAASRRMATAVSLAEQRLEQLKNTPYVNIVSESPPVNIDPDTGQVTANATKWTREVIVTAGSPMTNTKTVTVTVTWQDQSRTHQVPLVTIIGL